MDKEIFRLLVLFPQLPIWMSCSLEVDYIYEYMYNVCLCAHNLEQDKKKLLSMIFFSSSAYYTFCHTPCDAALWWNDSTRKTTNWLFWTDDRVASCLGWICMTNIWLKRQGNSVLRVTPVAQIKPCTGWDHERRCSAPVTFSDHIAVACRGWKQRDTQHK